MLLTHQTALNLFTGNKQVTTYSTYKCTVCKRTTEIEIDPTRPTYNHCIITHKCSGRLQKIGVKSVRSQLHAPYADGVSNWRPRQSQTASKEIVAKGEHVQLATGPDILTIAVHGVDPAESLLYLTLDAEVKIASNYTRYSFFNFKVPTKSVMGTDSTAERKILRFDNQTSTPDYLRVTLNGIELSRAVMAAGHATVMNGIITAVTIDQEGSGYDVAPQVLFAGGFGTGAIGEAVLDGDAVIGVNVIAGGSNYSGQIAVSFIGGITERTVYYSKIGEIVVEPAIPIGSTLDIVVTPFIASATTTLTFIRQNDASSFADQGAWSNIKTIHSRRAYSVFTCSVAGSLEDDTHLTCDSLRTETDAIEFGDWYFLLSHKPNENVDRIFTLALQPAEAKISRMQNRIKIQELQVDSSFLASIYPPFTVSEWLSRDKIRGDAPAIEAPLISNSFILGSS